MSKIKIAVRTRPLNDRERSCGSSLAVKVDNDNKTVSVHNAGKCKTSTCSDDFTLTCNSCKHFAFDYCFWSADERNSTYADQQTVFDSIGTQVLDSLFDGYNACVFSYGQTGSGKTYTMIGTVEDPGLTSNICKSLVDRINCNTDEHKQFIADISYLEIYNEKVIDLLNKKKTKNGLRVREHPKFGPYVEDLTRHSVNSFDDAIELLQKGNDNRCIGETHTHSHSSRSHAIFTINLNKQILLNNTQLGKTSSKLHLVDLAGSERATKEFCKLRLKEGANINKSLVALSNVITALANKSLYRSLPLSHRNNSNSADESSPNSSAECSRRESLSTVKYCSPKQPYVPYRDSVLTWLLKDMLGGNAKTIMIATITPSSISFNETMSTLRYALRAKSVVNRPITNEDANTRLIKELRAEIERLKLLLIAESEKAIESPAIPSTFWIWINNAPFGAIWSQTTETNQLIKSPSSQLTSYQDSDRDEALIINRLSHAKVSQVDSLKPNFSLKAIQPCEAPVTSTVNVKSTNECTKLGSGHYRRLTKVANSTINQIKVRKEKCGLQSGKCFKNKIEINQYISIRRKKDNLCKTKKPLRDFIGLKRRKHDRTNYVVRKRNHSNVPLKSVNGIDACVIGPYATLIPKHTLNKQQNSGYTKCPENEESLSRPLNLIESELEIDHASSERQIELNKSAYFKLLLARKKEQLKTKSCRDLLEKILLKNGLDALNEVRLGKRTSLGDNKDLIWEGNLLKSIDNESVLFTDSLESVTELSCFSFYDSLENLSTSSSSTSEMYSSIDGEKLTDSDETADDGVRKNSATKETKRLRRERAMVNRNKLLEGSDHNSSSDDEEATTSPINSRTKSPYKQRTKKTDREQDSEMPNEEMSAEDIILQIIDGKPVSTDETDRQMDNNEHNFNSQAPLTWVNFETYDPEKVELVNGPSIIVTELCQDNLTPDIIKIPNHPEETIDVSEDLDCQRQLYTIHEQTTEYSTFSERDQTPETTLERIKHTNLENTTMKTNTQSQQTTASKSLVECITNIISHVQTETDVILQPEINTKVIDNLIEKAIEKAIVNIKHEVSNCLVAMQPQTTNKTKTNDIQIIGKLNVGQKQFTMEENSSISDNSNKSDSTLQATYHTAESRQELHSGEISAVDEGSFDSIDNNCEQSLSDCDFKVTSTKSVESEISSDFNENNLKIRNKNSDTSNSSVEAFNCIEEIITTNSVITNDIKHSLKDVWRASSYFSSASSSDSTIEEDAEEFISKDSLFKEITFVDKTVASQTKTDTSNQLNSESCVNSTFKTLTSWASPVPTDGNGVPLLTLNILRKPEAVFKENTFDKTLETSSESVTFVFLGPGFRLNDQRNLTKNNVKEKTSLKKSNSTSDLKKEKPNLLSKKVSSLEYLNIEELSNVVKRGWNNGLNKPIKPITAEQTKPTSWLHTHKLATLPDKVNHQNLKPTIKNQRLRTTFSEENILTHNILTNSEHFKQSQSLANLSTNSSSNFIRQDSSVVELINETGNLVSRLNDIFSLMQEKFNGCNESLSSTKLTKTESSWHTTAKRDSGIATGTSLSSQLLYDSRLISQPHHSKDYNHSKEQRKINSDLYRYTSTPNLNTNSVYSEDLNLKRIRTYSESSDSTCTERLIDNISKLAEPKVMPKELQKEIEDLKQERKKVGALLEKYLKTPADSKFPTCNCFKPEHSCHSCTNKTPTKTEPISPQLFRQHLLEIRRSIVAETYRERLERLRQNSTKTKPSPVLVTAQSIPFENIRPVSVPKTNPMNSASANDNHLKNSTEDINALLKECEDARTRAKMEISMAESLLFDQKKHISRVKTKCEKSRHKQYLTSFLSDSYMELPSKLSNKNLLMSSFPTL